MAVKMCKDIPITECQCPKCGTKHKMQLLWIGRGIPRKFCDNCSKSISKLEDVHTEIFNDWRFKNV